MFSDTKLCSCIRIEEINNRRDRTKLIAHPGNRTPVSTVGGYYDTTTPDALIVVNGATTKNLGERQTQHMK